MPVNLSPAAGAAAQFFTDNGVPLAGGLIYTYAAGTTTPQAAYTSSTGGTAWSNPIVLNSAGRVSGGGEIWLTGNLAYKFVLYDSTSVLIATYDQIRGVGDTTELLAFEALLAGSTGSSLVGFLQAGTGAIATTVQTKLRQTVAAEDFGMSSSASAAANAAAFIVACISCIAQSKSLVLSALYPITTAIIDGYDGLNIISNGGGLVGQTTGTYNAVLEIKNVTAVTIQGVLAISAAYNTGYTAGVWAHGTTGIISQLDLHDIQVNYAQVGFMFGDPAYPDKQISEITVVGGYSFGCPIGAKVIGTQSVVNFIGTRLQSDYASGTGAWLTLEATTVSAVGGAAIVVGGECIQAVITTGSTFKISPIVSATYSNPWGVITANSVVVEPAGQLLVATNPAAVPTPGVGASQGALTSIVNTIGYHSKMGSPFVQTSSDFNGTIRVRGCKFSCNTATETSVTAGSTSTTLDIDSTSFGANFSSVIQTASTGGTRIIDDATEGSFTPTFTGLTVVNGTGGAVYTGNWTRIGRLVNWQALITVTGTCTVASTATATYLDNLPFVVVAPSGTFTVADNASVSLGVGIYGQAFTWAFLPGFAARNSTIYLSGFYTI